MGSGLEARSHRLGVRDCRTLSHATVIMQMSLNITMKTSCHV